MWITIGMFVIGYLLGGAVVGIPYLLRLPEDPNPHESLFQEVKELRERLHTADLTVTLLQKEKEEWQKSIKPVKPVMRRKK